MDRVIIAHTPPENGALLFKSLSGHEGLSEPFEFDVELLHRSNGLKLKNLLGKPLTIELRGAILSPRFLNGYITRMTLTGRETRGERYYIYRAMVRPGLWYLTQNRDFRIWQEKSVPDIIASVLSGYQIKFENKLTWDYRQWGYCVQYQESDFDFISRLMEHEGIYYYFTHQRDGHTLVLADAPQTHDALPGYATIPYQPFDSDSYQNTGSIHSWSVSDAITPSMYSLDDYDFRKPRARLLETRQNPVSCASDKAEVFDWPGHFTDREHGQFYVRVRQQEFEACHELMSGESSCLGLAPGYTFLLAQAPRAEDQREYLTTRVEYLLTENAYASSEGETAEHRLTFSVVPGNVNWRPARATAWPKTHGPQTAEVVGPEGQSIWTDKYGRVKLKFRWDRYGNGDDSSSCWVRVSSSWAGWKYGGIQIPRVGEEVVVDFINGDPDRPLITGRVYNENNMPPWDLPNDATKMGFMSRSTDGSPDNANYLFFEDSPGGELFDMHAEKDMNISVEGDKSVTIDGTRTTTIEKMQDDDVKGDATFHFHGKRSTTVDGNETKILNDRESTTIKNGRELDIVSGGDNIRIKDGRKTDITGTNDLHVTGKVTEQLDDARDTTVDQTADLHVKGKVTEKLDAGVDTTIKGGLTETVSGGITQTIDGGVEINVESGDWVQNVNSGKIDIYSPNEITIKSKVKVSIDVPYFSSRASGHKESFTGNSFSATAASESLTGFSLSLNGLSISRAQASLAHNVVAITYNTFGYSNKPMELRQIGTLIHSGVLSFSSKALTLLV